MPLSSVVSGRRAIAYTASLKKEIVSYSVSLDDTFDFSLDSRRMRRLPDAEPEVGIGWQALRSAYLTSAQALEVSLLWIDIDCRCMSRCRDMQRLFRESQPSSFVGFPFQKDSPSPYSPSVRKLNSSTLKTLVRPFRVLSHAHQTASRLSPG